jgi:hypothetical protein
MPIHINFDQKGWWRDFPFDELETLDDVAEFEQNITLAIDSMQTQLDIFDMEGNCDAIKYANIRTALTSAKSAQKLCGKRRKELGKLEYENKKSQEEAIQLKFLAVFERIATALEALH